MLAVVKKPRTNLPLFEVKGNIPSKVIKYLHQVYGQNIELVDEDEERIKIVETDWYREIKSATTPGNAVSSLSRKPGPDSGRIRQKAWKIFPPKYFRY